MNDERDERRYAGRRAALHAELRDGHALTAARAASRLRVDGFPLTPVEFARARSVRRALGYALVQARIRARVGPPAVPGSAATVAPIRRRSRRWLAAAAFAAAALVLILLFGTGVGLRPGGGSPPPRTAVEVSRAPLVLISRGRTISLPAEVVVVAESPTPTPTAQPSATASPSGSAAVGTNAPGSQSGTGPSGSGGGSGGGDGGGVGVIPKTTPTPAPTPAPTATPVVPSPGFSRLNVLVLDYSTGRPLEGVCIVIGTLNCGPNAPHTNADGRWSADVAASSSSTRWDMYFIKTAYLTEHRQITLPGGVSRTYIIYLRRQP
jgi:hypothetical protein